ncbi:hypothetical protein [Sulfurovum sp. AR]|uniref:hypothetical protein n=1 Tax=Sulfurovum sp. AR TaxID=1165841 RepID=UPI00025C4F21|nr:hypothetical protein [Sulfurovum sp. AR]EIF51168.1 hypothetical protein SULAR_04738 [Sulfurovum sp. AR]
MQNRTKIPTPFGIKNSMVKYLIVIISLFFILPSSSSAVEGSWVELNGKVYGAKPDYRGPIGGGAGYFDIKTSGDYTVTSYSELVSAISSASTDDVIYIPESATIDFTGQPSLYISKKLTFASNRGIGGSTGGVIKNDSLSNNYHKTIVVNIDGVRFTGLDIQGPSGTEASVNMVTGISTEKNNIEVDNCLIHGWTYAGIRSDRSGNNLNVHHCDIYDNKRPGYGYGVSVFVGHAEINYNKFGNNRHNIASSGDAGTSYTARNNITYGAGTNILFDMHGGDGDGTTAGNVIFENNYVGVRDREGWGANNVRGEPRDRSDYHYNWYVGYVDGPDAMWVCSTCDMTNVYMSDNIYGDGYSPAPTEEPAKENIFILDPNTKTLRR